MTDLQHKPNLSPDTPIEWC